MTKRLDLALVERGLVRTRARARDAILRGHVTVNGKLVARPATTVEPDAAIALDDPASGYVSRGSLKMIAALDRFGYSPKGRVALDIGASTGGFTQVLLERGAAKVYAIDVGHGQLDPELAADPRVDHRARASMRAISSPRTSASRPAPSSPMSASSRSELVLPPVLALAGHGAWGVFLVKPQFEVGRQALGKGGIVRDAGLAEQTAADIAALARKRDGLARRRHHPVADRRRRRQSRIPARRPP